MELVKTFIFVLMIIFILLVLMILILLIYSRNQGKAQVVSKVINKSTRYNPSYVHLRAIYEDSVTYATTQLENVKAEDIRSLDDCTIYLHSDNRTIEVYLSTYLGAPIVVLADLNNDGYVLLFKSAVFVSTRLN